MSDISTIKGDLYICDGIYQQNIVIQLLAFGNIIHQQYI